MRFYVYELIDPRNGSVFYVGKGQGDRINQHEYEAKNGRVSDKYDTIRAIIQNGLYVVKRKVAQFEDEVSAYAFEALHMESFKKGDLTNKAAGGFGGRYSFKNSDRIIEDRDTLIQCAELFTKALEEGDSKWSVQGDIKDRSKEISEYLHRSRKIAADRGAAWVNKITKRYGVTFIAAESEGIDIQRTETKKETQTINPHWLSNIQRPQSELITQI